MQLLKYLLILLLVIFSCKRNINNYNKKNNVSNKKEVSKIIQPSDTVYTEGNHLIIFDNSKKIKFPNLVVNASSVFTSLDIIDYNSFYLTYEYSASTTKMIQIYEFLIDNEKLFLVWKEVLKLNKGNFGANKIYYKKLEIPKDKSLEFIESLGVSLEVSYSSDNKRATTYVYDEFYKKIDSVMYSITGLDRFMNPLKIR